MGSITSLHPELLALTDLVPDIVLTRERLPAIREAAAQFVKTLETAPEGVTKTETRVPARGDSPPIRTLVYEPKDSSAKPRPAIVLLHGGGFVTGEPEQVSVTAAQWCKALGATIVCPAYRLAPENPFPAALEDAYSTLAWVSSSAAELGVDCSRIAVAGESAGGGLAACLAHLVRDRGEFSLCFQYLLFPMLDDRTCVREDLPSHQGQIVWTRANNRFAWRSYLTEEPGDEGVPSYAAAARADRFDGLPPTFIATGDLDLFCIENSEYVTRLMTAGIRTRFQVYPGAPHAFPLISSSSAAKSLHQSVLTAFRDEFE